MICHISHRINLGVLPFLDPAVPLLVKPVDVPSKILCFFGPSVGQLVLVDSSVLFLDDFHSLFWRLFAHSVLAEYIAGHRHTIAHYFPLFSDVNHVLAKR
jgi:hypothetical protein